MLLSLVIVSGHDPPSGLLDLIICSRHETILYSLTKYSFLMVNQCSYCVLKVPNDDGPSMSIIEFFLLFPLSHSNMEHQEQFNQLPQTLFFSLSRNPCYCHKSSVKSGQNYVLQETHWFFNTKKCRVAQKNLTNMGLHMSLPPICKSVKSNHDFWFCFSCMVR